MPNARSYVTASSMYPVSLPHFTVSNWNVPTESKSTPVANALVMPVKPAPPFELGANISSAVPAALSYAVTALI